jgi:predicted 3-demethylubiquinone-9 3-methyltransferase (glyoxalase superfamily)
MREWILKLQNYMQKNQKITPFLWFEDKAEEAANYYAAIFKDSKIISVARYDEAGAKASGQPVGSVMVVGFQLAGQDFAALNGGPPPAGGFQPFGAVSLVVNCDTQEEVDYFWEKLSDGGEAGVCGWINHDKFGVTWQVTPTILTEMLNDKDPEKAKRVMEAMLEMKKIIIADLEKAYNEK